MFSTPYHITEKIQTQNPNVRFHSLCFNKLHVMILGVRFSEDIQIQLQIQKNLAKVRGWDSDLRRRELAMQLRGREGKEAAI